MSDTLTAINVDGIDVSLHHLQDEFVNERFNAPNFLVACFSLGGQGYTWRGAYRDAEGREMEMDCLREAVRRAKSKSEMVCTDG